MIEVDPILLTVLGVAAGVLILTGWVDQIYKGYKSKSLKDVSSFLMIFISAGAILWLIYGIIVIDVFIIGTNIAAIVLMGIVLTMKRGNLEIKPETTSMLLENLSATKPVGFGRFSSLISNDGSKFIKIQFRLRFDPINSTIDVHVVSSS